ncbi:hypothetical protein GCM10028806_34640 [Spirosoma terrae]
MSTFSIPHQPDIYLDGIKLDNTKEFEMIFIKPEYPFGVNAVIHYSDRLKTFRNGVIDTLHNLSELHFWYNFRPDQIERIENQQITYGPETAFESNFHSTGTIMYNGYISKIEMTSASGYYSGKCMVRTVINQGYHGVSAG